MINCPFTSLQELNDRLQFNADKPRNASCAFCSVAKTLAFSINSKNFCLLPLIHFPKSGTAIVLPVVFGDFDQTMISHWIAHNTRVLGADTVVVYSQNSSETFDRNGRLWPFYSSYSASNIVIVDIPQIQGLKTHYFGQQFAINDAFLRSIGAAEFLGCFDADEFLEIPPGRNITAYLRQKFCNSDSTCTQFSFTALGIGSFMVDSYSSIIGPDDHFYFCTTGHLNIYSYLPTDAECNGGYSDPKVRWHKWMLLLLITFFLLVAAQLSIVGVYSFRF
jgi:hypothetical protein